MNSGELPDDLTATDPDGDSLTYEVVDGQLPDGLTLNPDGTWSGDVAGIQGRYEVTVPVCDPAGACDSEVLSLVFLGAVPDTGTTASVSRTPESPGGSTAFVALALGTFAGLGVLAAPRPRRRRRSRRRAG